jgi:hypothetical protein
LRTVARNLLLVAGTLVLCSLPSFAAGGTCPSGTYSIRNNTGTLSSLGVTSCYFVSKALGSDTNAGTTEGSPWAHAPGMHSCANNCSSTTISAGTGIILRGGDVWVASDLGLQWADSGSATHNNYVGVDQTWFNSSCGSSWCRPVFDLGSSAPTGSYYVFQNNGSTAIWTTFDNIEEKGWSCAAIGSPANMNSTISPDAEFENLYIHGWSYSGGDTSCQAAAFGANIADGASQVAGMLVHNNVVDGSDQSPSPVASPTTVDGPVECALHGDQFYNNVCRYIYDINGVFNSVYGNWIDHVLVGNSGDHCNMTNIQAPLTGSTIIAANNVYSNMNCGGGLILWLEGNSVSASTVGYAFGNVFYAVDSGAGQIISTCTHPTGTNCGQFYIFNNTAASGAGQQLTGNGETPQRGQVYAANNHLIGNATLLQTGGVFGFDKGNELIQTAAVANANTSPAFNQYSASQTPYVYAPVAVTNSTVGAGQTINATNINAWCPTNNPLGLTCATTSFTGLMALALSDTTFATENFTNHTVVMRSTNTRGTNFDIGAFQFSGGSTPANAPTFSPIAGTYVGAQSVTASTSSSGAIVCGNYTGSPATNGVSACAAGSFPPPFPVSSTATVFAVAGGTGFLDSAAASAHYIINYHPVQLPTTWVNNLEYLHATSNIISFPSTGTGGNWTCGVTNFGPYTVTPSTVAQAALQQAINDAETCRTSNNSGTLIIIPSGSLFTGHPGITLPQTTGDTSSNFIVLNSSTPLPMGQTVCSHGIQDNIPESTQIGLRNHGCNASQVTYQLATSPPAAPAQIITTLSGAFTLANGLTGNTSAYNDVASMYTLECSLANCNVLQTGAFDSNNVGPHHYAILNAEMRPLAGLVNVNAPVILGVGKETLVSQIPTHIHVAYSYVHGDWTDAPVTGGVATAGPTGANSVPAAFALRACINCSVTYNYADKFLRPGSENQGIVLGLAQQLKIVHNWFEGGSEGHICGGESAPLTITGFIICQDNEDRANRYTYPYSWMLAWDAGFCVNGLACAGESYVRKNAHEYKWGERIILDGNIFENVDNSGSQNGVVISFKTAQTSGGPLGTNYWDTMDNYTVTNNVTRNSCSGVSMGDRSVPVGAEGGGVSLPDEIALFQNNLLYNIDHSGPGCAGAAAQYGWRVAGGVPLTTWAATAARDSSGLTTTLTLTGGLGFDITDMAVGDPVNVSGCSDASFNTGVTVMGPPALTGTLLNGLTIVYGNPGTASATATGCTVSNSQGWPRYLTALHNTDIQAVSAFPNAPYNSANGGTNIWPLGRDLVFQNDIFINGGINSSYSEGTRTETKMFDPTSEVMNNTFIGDRSALVCPGATGAGCYTEYGGTFAGASPPQTVYLTPSAFCTGSDPTTGNCSGILAGMSQSGVSPAFPNAVTDWHNFRLCHAGDAACSHKASLYAAGQANQGSDGQDLGFNPVPIDAAEVSTQFVCPTSCGSGPFPDVPNAQTVLFRGGILQ